MKDAISTKRKIGRPATGVTPMLGFRADAATRAAVVSWAEKQPDQPSLSEAIRRLVEMGLSQTRKPGPRVLSTAKEAAARAEELAAPARDNRGRVSQPRKR